MKSNLSPLGTNNFSKLLYHKQATYILSTRNATNYLMYQPILSIYQLYHTPTFKIPYEIKFIALVKVSRQIKSIQGQ